MWLLVHVSASFYDGCVRCMCWNKVRLVTNDIWKVMHQKSHGHFTHVCAHYTHTHSLSLSAQALLTLKVCLSFIFIFCQEVSFGYIACANVSIDLHSPFATSCCFLLSRHFVPADILLLQWWWVWFVAVKTHVYLFFFLYHRHLLCSHTWHARWVCSCHEHYYSYSVTG